MEKLFAIAAEYRKAIASFTVAVLSALLVAIPAGGGFGDLTTTQWLGIALSVVGGPVAVAAVTNVYRKQ